MGFTQKQLMTEFTNTFLDEMLDYQFEKSMRQKHGN
jgi:hypothetical protein